MKEAIARTYSPIFNNRQINPNSEVLVTHGASQALFAICHHLLQPGDECLMFEPYYVNYANYADFAGAKTVTAPMILDPVTKTWEYDFETFERKLSPKTKVVMLINPHNPTGKMLSGEDIAKISKILEKRPDVIVIADDVYYHLPFDNKNKPYTTFANYGNNWEKTLTVYSAGKLFSCTGWKVGWIVGPADLVKHVSFVHESTCFNINVPCQVAIANSLDLLKEPYQGHENYPTYVQETFKDGYKESLKVLDSMKSIPMEPTHVEGGYFLPLKVTEECKA